MTHKEKAIKIQNELTFIAKLLSKEQIQICITKEKIPHYRSWGYCKDAVKDTSLEEIYKLFLWLQKKEGVLSTIFPKIKVILTGRGSAPLVHDQLWVEAKGKFYYYLRPLAEVKNFTVLPDGY